MFQNSPDHTYTFFFLRHGESVGNSDGFHQGQYDFPLTDRGRQQAQALAARWQAEKMTFDLVVSSPLARARRTAEMISTALNAPITFDPCWMERDNGQLSGLSHAEAAERFPRPPFITPYQPIGRTGESQWELYLRAGQALHTMLRRPPGRYLVVSHGGLLNMALYAALGIAPQANFQGPRFRFSNISFAVLRYNPAEHDWLLERLNDRTHWVEPEREHL